MEFLVEHNPGSTPTVHLTFAPEESLTTFVDGLALADNAGPDAAIWVHGTNEEDARRRPPGHGSRLV